MASPNPGLRVDLPDGNAVFYMDRCSKHPPGQPNSGCQMCHSYWRCKADGKRGKRLTGMTTGIKPVDFDPGRLLEWAARTNGIGVAMLASEGLALDDADAMRDALAWLNSADAIWAALEEADLTFDQVRDKAAVRGTNVHELALQALAEGRPVPDFDKMTPEERGYARGVMAFWLDHQPQVLQAEQVVCDSELGVAGRMDLRCTLGSEWRLGPGVVDAKTGYTGPKDHVQIAGYAHCADICGFGGSDWQAILKLKEDGTYELIPGVASQDDFLAALDLYRRRGRIEREAKKAWGAACRGGGAE